MHRDPVANADPDRGDLSIFYPDSSQAGARRRNNADGREGLHEKIFEPAQVTMEVLSAIAQIDDWVPDQLTWPVIGCLAAAINRKQGIGQMLRAAQTRLIRRSPDRVNRIVFEQKQFVA